MAPPSCPSECLLLPPLTSHDTTTSCAVLHHNALARWRNKLYSARSLPCLTGSSMGGSRGAPQLSASPRASQQSAAGSIKNVRPPPLMHYPIHRLRATAHQKCNRDRRSRKGDRLRLSRVSANGIYDTNDPQSYVSQVRRQWAASQVDELWDRWRAVEVKKRRRT